MTGINPQGKPEPDKIIYASLMAQASKEKDSDTKARLLGLGLMYLDVSKPEKQTLDGMLAALGPNYLHFSRGLGILTGGQTLPKLR